MIQKERVKAKHRRNCERKVRFGSQAEAWRTARMYDQYVYECPNCRGFHCATKKARPW